MAEIQIGRLVKDFEIAARIYMQVRTLQPETYLSHERHEQLMSVVIKLMQKLEKAKYHAGRCGEIPTPSPDIVAQPNARHVDHASGAEAEAEAFLVQAKASLDILAKTLGPTAGIRLATFGEKGEKVLKALKRNVSADRAPRASALIRLIEEDRAWLTEMIVLRDTVTHFDGLRSSGASAELIDGKVVITPPTDEQGRPLAVVVDWLYRNLLTFCEDFVALAIALALPLSLNVQVVAASDRTDLLKSKFALAFAVTPA